MFSPSRLSRTLIATIWLLQPVTAPLQAAGFELPEMGDSAGVHLPAGKEKRLGQAFMRSVRANTTIESDPLLTDYLQDLIPGVFYWWFSLGPVGYSVTADVCVKMA